MPKDGRSGWIVGARPNTGGTVHHHPRTSASGVGRVGRRRRNGPFAPDLWVNIRAMITHATSLATMPAHARVWVYKTARPFTPDEERLIRDRGAAFTSSWAAHGAPLDAVVEVLHGHFVVVAVDEEQARASGCSIDKSVRFIQALEQDLGRSLTDRMVVVYERDDAVRSCRVDEVEDLLDEGELHAGTVVFDDLVTTKGDLDARFRIALRDSWMERFL